MGVWLVLVFAALPILLKLIDVAGHRKCRACASNVRREAKRCPQCGADPKAALAR